MIEVNVSLQVAGKGATRVNTALDSAQTSLIQSIASLGTMTLLRLSREVESKSLNADVSMDTYDVSGIKAYVRALDTGRGVRGLNVRVLDGTSREVLFESSATELETEFRERVLPTVSTEPRQGG